MEMKSVQEALGRTRWRTGSDTEKSDVQDEDNDNVNGREMKLARGELDGKMMMTMMDRLRDHPYQGAYHRHHRDRTVIPHKNLQAANRASSSGLWARVRVVSDWCLRTSGESRTPPKTLGRRCCIFVTCTIAMHCGRRRVVILIYEETGYGWVGNSPRCCKLSSSQEW